MYKKWKRKKPRIYKSKEKWKTKKIRKGGGEVGDFL